MKLPVQRISGTGMSCKNSL